MKFCCFFLCLMLCDSVVAQVKEDTITLPTANGNIYGSIFTPKKKKSFPVVLIIAGSGPTDRYGNSPMGVRSNTYRMIAKSLAKNNIATVSYDKRGIARSEWAFKKEEDLRFEDYVNDAVDWINLLKKDKRVTGVFIAGHSEGSLIGMLASQQTDVKGYISLAGPARGIAAIIVEQYAKQLPQAARVVDSLFSRLKRNIDIDTVPPYLLSILRPGIQPYIKSWIKYTPCDEFKKMTIPALIIQGGTDIQVEPNEAAMLKECNPSATLLLLENMNHVLKNAPKDRVKNISTYSNADLPLSENLTESMVGFIKKNNSN